MTETSDGDADGTRIIDGEAVAADVRDDVAAHVETLEEEGVTPGLATVLMSDDPASETYVSMKQRDCEEVGIESVHVEIDADAPAEELYETIDDLNEREDVHGILVQLPVPDHVDKRRVLRQIAPVKDVDGFHPENVGRLVAGDARFKPCTPHGVQKLLAAYDVETEGRRRGRRRPVGYRREADGEPPDPEGADRQRDHDRLPLADEGLGREGRPQTS